MPSGRPKVALITGVTGQDGSYLAELLVGKEYEVHGMLRRVSSASTRHLEALLQTPAAQRVHLHYGEMSDGGRLMHLIREVEPDELYHLAAQSEAGLSFELPVYTAEVTGVGTLRVLEAVRHSRLPVKVFHAASSEMYGAPEASPQNEHTPFRPRSPYAMAKLLGYWAAVNYREAYGLFICNGLLFNHESPRRGENFVTRKITRAAARITAGVQDRLTLGDLSARRDWGYAPDYVRGMWAMLQQEAPDDYVLATGETHSVEEFAAAAFREVGLEWREYVDVAAHHFRSARGEDLRGDASKARTRLGWTATTRFDDLVRIMVAADVALARQELSAGEAPR